MTDITTYGRRAGVQRIWGKPAVPLNPDCPNCQALLRGRKGEAREGELMTAERTALGYTRKRPTGIYRKRP